MGRTTSEMKKFKEELKTKLLYCLHRDNDTIVLAVLTGGDCRNLFLSREMAITLGKELIYLAQEDN